MKVLMRSTVHEFFRQKAGLFFVALGVLFGFLRAAEHHAFAEFFLTNAFGPGYLLLMWVTYTLFCAQFVRQLWQQPTYTFIYEVRLLDVQTQLFRLAGLAAGFLQPVLYYGVYLLAIGIELGVYRAFVFIIPIYALLIAMLTAVMLFCIRHPHIIDTKKRLLPIPFKRPNSWVAWTIEWLFREKGITMLTGKAGAMLVCSATILYYSTGDYDLRMPAVGMSLAYLLNAGISMELFKWESEVWLWGRSLPVDAFRRFLRVLSVHAIIILPESLMMFQSDKLSFAAILQLFLLGLAMLIFLHLYFYKKRGNPESFPQTALFGFIGLTLLILYRVPLPVIAGLAIVAVWWKFQDWYFGK